jgi:hypothetical protein
MRPRKKKNVLFIGTQFSSLYTAVDTPAEPRDVVHDVCVLVCDCV